MAAGIAGNGRDARGVGMEGQCMRAWGGYVGCGGGGCGVLVSSACPLPVVCTTCSPPYIRAARAEGLGLKPACKPAMPSAPGLPLAVPLAWSPSPSSPPSSSPPGRRPPPGAVLLPRGMTSLSRHPWSAPSSLGRQQAGVGEKAMAHEGA